MQSSIAAVPDLTTREREIRGKDIKVKQNPGKVRVGRPMHNKDQSGKASPWVVRFNKQPNAKLRVICLHYAGGSASIFRSWPDKLSSSVELVAIQFPGREGRFKEPHVEGFEELMDSLIAELEPILDLPYVVFGHSLGSLVGFELIMELRRRNLAQPELFIPSGRKPPHLKEEDEPIAHLPEDQFVEELLKEYADKLGDVLAEKDLRDMFVPQIRADFALSETYQYRKRDKFDFPIVAFGGEKEKKLPEPDLLSWHEHTNKTFNSKRFPGEHFFIHDSETMVVEAVNQELEGVLEQLSE